MAYNPEKERLHLGRDLTVEESGSQFSDGTISEIVNTKWQLHVSSLTPFHIRRILQENPRSDPYDLFVDAIGELKLPEVQFAHARKPRLYCQYKRKENFTRYYVALSLDKEGERRLRRDAQKILGYFGINGSSCEGFDPHITIATIDRDEEQAKTLVERVANSLKRPEPVEFSFPIVDYIKK